MGGRFVLEVPETVTTRFLVATQARTLPGPGRLPAALGDGALAREAAAMLASAGLAVELVTRPSADLTARFHRLAAPHGRLGAVVGARRHIAVTAEGPPAGQPRSAQAARFAARAPTAARASDSSGPVPCASPPHAGPAEDTWWRAAAEAMPKIARAAPDPPGRRPPRPAR